MNLICEQILRSILNILILIKLKKNLQYLIFKEKHRFIKIPLKRDSYNDAIDFSSNEAYTIIIIYVSAKSPQVCKTKS